ncbi:hypothetical protein BN7_3580 [Wickerhamomyces ciferrii]|uniref:Protein kinase domain-containing protein n=1 Tax=Wickerhamomyces ciferrii (strain ATCC 14091 / BCRC 22168 / CBS 111 / JCM 3599 / NBRC 0793 / NRRL Y-1031 F-60-10) TaxID=1206466 RepID=K0KRQ1_WICCF|nr:uncharacterized protein BN7_3580 [Wickerhamomyces ciferrii]CCH44023.1 hypothetical protein BN7_3580 [Wickerhamomyces ciferrii]
MEDRINSNNLSIFNHSFKNIKFQSVEEIKNDELYRNIHELELFIDYSLNKIDEMKAEEGLRSLLDVLYSNQLYVFNLGLDLGRDIKLRAEAMDRLILEPMFRFISYLLSIDNDIRFETFDRFIEKSKPSLIWDSLSSMDDDFGSYPKNLRDEEMFHSHISDFSLNLFDSNCSRIPICGIDIEGWEFSKILENNNKKTDGNFANLSKIFRQVAPFQIFGKFNSYIISNFNNTIYLEYPLKDGKWESDNEEDVFIAGAPVRYKLFDNNADTPADSFSIQLSLLLKIYDTIRRKLCTDSWLKDSNGDDLLNQGTYRSLDEGWNEKKFNPFVISQFNHGFKKNVALNKMEMLQEEEIKDFKNTRASKRLKLQKESEGDKIFDSTKLFPTNVSLKTSNYELLEQYSYFRGIKLIIDQTSIFKSNTSNISNKVFFKMFDLANVKYLHWYRTIVGMPYYEDEAKEFNQSEINVLFTLEDHSKNFKHILENIKESYIKEITALKKINHWNSTHGKSDHINTPNLLQYGWTNLELLSSEGKLKYSYWGPFICTECLEFINDNEYEKNSQREKNLNEQIKILYKSGIDHNDIRKYNYCFDEYDNAYLVDYGQSIIDDNRYLENYDLQKIDPDEKFL